jgi:hypothetical protein
MNNLFDAGHTQLHETRLSGAWRRAAESSVRHHHAPAAAPRLPDRYRKRALLAAAAVSVVTGLCLIAESTQGWVEQPSVDAAASAPLGERTKPLAANSVADPVAARAP